MSSSTTTTAPAAATMTSTGSSSTQTKRRPGKLVNRTDRLLAWTKRNRVKLLWFFVYTFGLAGCTINAYIMTGWYATLSLLGRLVVGFACASFPLELVCAFLIPMQWDTHSSRRATAITAFECLVLAINAGLTTGQLVHYHAFGDYEYRWAQRPDGKGGFLEAPELRAFQAAWSWGLVSTAFVTASCLLSLLMAPIGNWFSTMRKAMKEREVHEKTTGNATSTTGSHADNAAPV